MLSPVRAFPGRHSRSWSLSLSGSVTQTAVSSSEPASVRAMLHDRHRDEYRSADMFEEPVAPIDETDSSPFTASKDMQRSADADAGVRNRARPQWTGRLNPWT